MVRPLKANASCNSQLNASDDRGIDVVREQIKNFASTKMSGGGAYVVECCADFRGNASQADLMPSL